MGSLGNDEIAGSESTRTGPHVLVPAQTRVLQALLESRESLGAHHAAHASYPQWSRGYRSDTLGTPLS